MSLILITHQLLKPKLVMGLIDTYVEDLLLMLDNLRIEKMDALLLSEALYGHVLAMCLLNK